MINILVPTDFSDLAAVAVRYAVKTANILDANVTLLHVIPITEPVTASIRARVKPYEDAMIHDAEEELANLVKGMTPQLKNPASVRYRVSTGQAFLDVLNLEVKRLGADLIVMGTRGASGIKKALMGSNTTAVIGNSSVPVLAVPERGEFRGISHIIHATDLKHLDHELSILMPLVQRFGSTLHLLHILPQAEEVERTEERINEIIRTSGYRNIVPLVLVDEDIEAAIGQYVNVLKADLLAMFTHDLTFFEKLFNKSITRNVAFHSTIPLLAFRQPQG